MHLAYLVTQYPKVSHTFIRREIGEIERRGHTVIRLAIRHPGQEFRDAEDRAEEAKTFHCLEQPMLRLGVATIKRFLKRPRRMLEEIGRAIRSSIRSEIGLVRNLSYVVEASLLLEFLDRKRVDHLHAHFANSSAAVARCMRRLGGPPFSFTAHGTDLFDATGSLDIDGKLAEAEFVVAVCDYTAGQILRWSLPNFWHKIHIVRCAVEEVFLERIEPVGKTTNIFVCIGRLSAEKGQARLLEAFAKLTSAENDAKLVLVGDGKMRPMLEALSRKLEIDDRVEITGFLDGEGVCQQILNARAVIVPSFMEGLPVVIMEAFSLGRPVIASCVGGIPELVRPRKNGWLVAPGNVEQMVYAMQEAIVSPAEELDRMGCRGRKTVEIKHRLSAEVDRLERLFAK